MIKRFFISTSFIGCFFFSQAQFDTSFVKTNIRRCADSLAYGFKTKNWEVFARYSYPALIGSIGGKQEFINYITKMFMQIPDSAWKVYAPGSILQVVKTAGDLQAIIEFKSVIEWQGSRITTISYMVGECWDGGLFWTFFDSQNDAAIAKIIMPELSEQLIIPKRNEKRISLPALSKQ